MWHYETTTETFLIQMVRPGEYELWMNHRLLGIYSDCASAALDVYACSTGDPKWDRKEHPDAPAKIEDWLPGEPETYIRE